MIRSGGVFMGSAVIGLAIAAFFFIGGIAFTIVIPEIWIGQIWIAVSVILGLVFFLIGRSAAGKAKLMRDGIRGTAQILSADQTGVYVNEQPQMRLRLRVEAPGITPFETTRSMVVPFIALATLGSGRPQTAFIDREDHERIAIDWEAALAGANAAPAPQPQPTPVNAPAEPQTTLDRLQELMELKNKQLISDEEFAAQKARILGQI